MGSIAFIKQSNLLNKGIVKLLQRKTPEYQIKTYDQAHYDSICHKEHRPDIVVIAMNASTNIYNLVEHFSAFDIKIAVESSETESNALTELFKLGLHGYLYKDMGVNELQFAFKTILSGRQYIHPQLSPVLLNDYIRITRRKQTRPEGLLSEREWEVLEQITKGKSNSEIGKDLFIATKTVNAHVGSILKKLHVPDRTNAALLAIKKNWFAL
ncbi:MAG TPA: response regulator transcription factor [Bacillota bacterium]|nr:response regulator transcription factor [Bacillota bacterium]